MKRLLAALLAFVTAAVLCGCGGAGTVPQQDDAEPVTLRIVTSYGREDGNRKTFEAAVAEYEQLTGNIIQDNSDTANEEWKARVLADFETGSEPDVLFFFTDADAEPMIRGNKVVPLDEIRQEYPDYAGNMQPDRLPTASNGKCYAVPIMGYWEFLYVNKEILNRCGVALPGADYSWDQFLADCAAIREKGVTPIACSLAEVSHYWFEFAVLNNGSADTHSQVPTVDAQGNLVDDGIAEKWIAGLEDIRELYDLGAFPYNTLTAGDSETAAMFGDGKTAFLLDGSWKMGYFREQCPDMLDSIAVCFVPAKGERIPSQTIGGISTGFFITRKAWQDPEKRQAAVEFVSHMTSDRVISGFVTTEATALAQEIHADNLDPLQQSAAQTLAATTRLVGAVQDRISREARASLFANIQNVVTGEMTAREAVETAMRLN